MREMGLTTLRFASQNTQTLTRLGGGTGWVQITLPILPPFAPEEPQAVGSSFVPARVSIEEVNLKGGIGVKADRDAEVFAEPTSKAVLPSSLGPLVYQRPESTALIKEVWFLNRSKYGLAGEVEG